MHHICNFVRLCFNKNKKGNIKIKQKHFKNIKKHLKYFLKT